MSAPPPEGEYPVSKGEEDSSSQACDAVRRTLYTISQVLRQAEKRQGNPAALQVRYLLLGLRQMADIFDHFVDLVAG